MAEVWEALYAALRAAIEAHDEFTIGDDSPPDIYLKEVVKHLFTPLSKLDAIVAPTVNDDSDDGYSVDSHWYDLTAKKAYVCLNPAVGEAVWVEVTQSGGAGALDYVCVIDEKYKLTSGGTFTYGAYRTRDLNVIRADTGSIIVLLDSNQLTLPVGTYRCHISAPAHKVYQHQARLRNVTGSATLLDGSSESTYDSATAQSRSFIAGLFTLGEESVLEVQHISTNTQSADGFGRHIGLTGADNVYTIAEFWKRG